MYFRFLTLFLLFLCYSLTILSNIEAFANGLDGLVIYPDAYNVEWNENSPIPGSKAVVFYLDIDFPPSELIEFYESRFANQGASMFPFLGATREWRTYHKFHEGNLFRTKEYLSSWWNHEKDLLYSLALRYTTPATLKKDTTKLKIVIQRIPFSETDYKALKIDK